MSVEVGEGKVLAATAIRAAPEGFEPGYVLALVASEGEVRLVRLDLVSPPKVGDVVVLT